MKIKIISLLCLLPLVAMAQSAESDALFAKGVSLYQARQYEEAIATFEAMNRIDSIQLDPASPRLGYGSGWIASCWYKLGQTDKAKAIDPYSYECTPPDRRRTVACDSVSGLIAAARDRGDQSETLRLQLECIRLEREAIPTMCPYRVNTMAACAGLLGQMQRFDEALDMVDTAIKAASSCTSKGNPYRAIPMMVRADLLWSQNKFDEAGEQLTAAAEYLREAGQEQSQPYWEVLNMGLQLAFQMGEAEAVVEGGYIVLGHAVEQWGLESEQHLQTLEIVSEMCQQLGDTTCLQLGPHMVDIARKMYGGESVQYGMACVKMAKYAGAFQRLDLMRKYLLVIDSLLPVVNPENPENHLLNKALLAETYLIENPDTAMMIIDDALSGLQRLDATQPLVAQGLNMCRYFKGLLAGTAGNYAEAVALIEPALGGLDKVGTPLSHQNNRLLLAYYQCMAGQYAEGKRSGLEAINQMRQLLSDPTTGGMARGQLKMLTQTVNIFKQAHDGAIFAMPDSVRYTYGLLYRELLATQMEQQARLDDYETADFFRTLEDYGRASYWTKDYQATRRVVSLYADTVRRRFGEQSWEYDRCLDALAHCYEDSDTALHHLLERQIAIEQKLYGKRHRFVRQKQEQYYKATGNHEALLAIKRRHHDRSDAYDLAGLYKANDNYESALRHYRDAFARALRGKGDISELQGASFGIFECMHRQGNLDDLPATCADMARQVQRRRPDDAQTFIVSMLRSQLYFAGIGLHTRCAEAVMALDDTKQRQPGLAAVLLAGRYGNAYIKEEQRDSVDRLYERAIALAKDNRQLADELALNRQKMRYETLHYDRRDSPDAAAIGREIEAIASRFANHDSLYDYHLGLALQLRAALAAADTTAVVTLARKMVGGPAPAELKDLFLQGELARITDSAYGNSSQPVSTADMCDLITRAVSHRGFDAATQERMAIFALQSQLHQIREHIGSPYYQSYVQADMERLMADATRLAVVTGSDSLAAYAYDAAILGKGALLRSQKLMRRHILQAGNETARLTLDELEQTILLQDNVASNHLDADSLAKRRTALEKQLLSVAPLFGDYTRGMTASWVDLQRRLKADECAIEFCSYREDSLVSYCALLLRPGLQTPRLVPLCTSADIAALHDDYYATDRLSMLLWQPLLPLLEGVGTVFFSATGQLHQIAIEYLPAIGRQGTMAECYQMYRLSNTRELLTSRTDTAKPKATLFGGVEYVLSRKAWQQLALQQTVPVGMDDPTASPPSITTAEVATRSAVDLARGSRTFLAGTDREVTSIEQTLTSSGISTLCLRGASATEGAFKAISGTDVTIIGIATHGFYQAPERTGDTSTDGVQEEEDEALSRSGLLLAGAFSTMQGDSIPDNVDDGVLTAREISRLDLTSASLVTLSACETALGDVSGDGVFGLQRGFKKAGAQTILMSLWKVDDQATQILMTEFFRQLTAKGNTSKRQAFINAQRHLRQYEGGRYDQPVFWAAFIMLDAL